MNLIICATPLQVLIAERIIKLHSKEKFFGLFITTRKITEKETYYFNRLKQHCYKCDYLLDTGDTELNAKKYILSFLKYKMRFFLMPIKKIFVANIEKLSVKMILKTKPQAKLYSFDDGSRNIIECNHKVFCDYHLPQKLHRKYIAKILGTHYKGYSAKQRIIKHYTIYANHQNIVKNTEYIPLFLGERTKLYPNNPKQNIKILIGQPEILDNIEELKSLILKTYQKFGINYYFPHPREEYTIEEINYINTPLIFEDYFLQNLQVNEIIIYTFCSTVALNMLSLPNVKIIAIKPYEITNPVYLDCYKLFQKMGIEIAEMRK